MINHKGIEKFRLNFAKSLPVTELLQQMTEPLELLKADYSTSKMS